MFLAKTHKPESTKTNTFCVVTCPTPLIVFNWSTIRLRSGRPLENIVWITMVYRASNRLDPSTTPPLHPTLLSLAYVICSGSCMAPSAQYPPFVHPVMHCFISFPLILWDPAKELTCYQHGCCTGLAVQETNKQTKNINKTTIALSIAGRGSATPMCHAICIDWQTLPLVPLVFAYVSSSPAWVDVPRFLLPTERLLRIMRQYCCCHSGINQLLVPLFAVSCELHNTFTIPLEWCSVRGLSFALSPFASSKERVRSAKWGQQVWPLCLHCKRKKVVQITDNNRRPITIGQ